MWKYEQALREATVSCPDGLTDVAALTRRIPCFLCYEAPDNETKVIVPCSALNQVYQVWNVSLNINQKTFHGQNLTTLSNFQKKYFRQESMFCGYDC